jgi:hypothetical protein
MAFGHIHGSVGIEALGPGSGMARCAETLWSRTDLKPTDVDVAEVYDGFSIHAVEWLEALELTPRGETGAFVDGGARIALDGELPISTGGGQLSVDTIPRMRHAELANPLVAAYATRDGRQVYLSGIQTENHFENFCEVVDRTDLLADERFTTGADRLAHRAELIALLDELFATRDLAEWVAALRGLTTPWSVVQTAVEAAVDQQVAANHLVVPVQGLTVEHPLVASPAQFDGVAPTLTRAPGHGGTPTRCCWSWAGRGSRSSS